MTNNDKPSRPKDDPIYNLVAELFFADPAKGMMGMQLPAPDGKPSPTRRQSEKRIRRRKRGGEKP